MSKRDESQSAPEPSEESGDEGQVSEVTSFKDPDEPISPEDSVAGAPDGESGRPDEGPTGPDAGIDDER